MPHSPHYKTTRRRNNPQPREQPAIPYSIQKRLRDDAPNTGEDIPHKVVQRDAGRRFLGHEFREHGRDHGEDEHTTDAEKEVGDQLEHMLAARRKVSSFCGGDLPARPKRYVSLPSSRTRLVPQDT